MERSRLHKLVSVFEVFEVLEFLAELEIQTIEVKSNLTKERKIEEEKK